MKAQQLTSTGTTDGTQSATWILAFEKGEEVMETLLEYAIEQKIRAASFVGLGAFSSGTVAFFDRESREYLPINIDEQVEVLNITGNIGILEEETRIHAHVTLSRPDGSAIGGHLLDGIIWPTLEITLTTYPTTLNRHIDEESGLALINIPSK